MFLFSSRTKWWKSACVPNKPALFDQIRIIKENKMRKENDKWLVSGPATSYRVLHAKLVRLTAACTNYCEQDMQTKAYNLNLSCSLYLNSKGRKDKSRFRNTRVCYMRWRRKTFNSLILWDLPSLQQLLCLWSKTRWIFRGCQRITTSMRATENGNTAVTDATVVIFGLLWPSQYLLT